MKNYDIIDYRQEEELNLHNEEVHKLLKGFEEKFAKIFIDNKVIQDKKLIRNKWIINTVIANIVAQSPDRDELLQRIVDAIKTYMDTVLNDTEYEITINQKTSVQMWGIKGKNLT